MVPLAPQVLSMGGAAYDAAPDDFAEEFETTTVRRQDRSRLVHLKIQFIQLLSPRILLDHKRFFHTHRGGPVDDSV